MGEALGKIRKALFHPKRGAKAAALLRQLVDAQLSPATAPLFRDCLTAAFLKQPAPAATAAQGTEEAQQAPHDDSRATEVLPVDVVELRNAAAVTAAVAGVPAPFKEAYASLFDALLAHVGDFRAPGSRTAAAASSSSS